MRVGTMNIFFFKLLHGNFLQMLFGQDHMCRTPMWGRSTAVHTQHYDFDGSDSIKLMMDSSACLVLSGFWLNVRFLLRSTSRPRVLSQKESSYLKKKKNGNTLLQNLKCLHCSSHVEACQRLQHPYLPLTHQAPWIYWIICPEWQISLQMAWPCCKAFSFHGSHSKLTALWVSWWMHQRKLLKWKIYSLQIPMRPIGHCVTSLVITGDRYKMSFSS